MAFVRNNGIKIRDTVNREHLSLEKDHYIDVCIIASGSKEFKSNDVIYQKRRVFKGDYQLTKGSYEQLRLAVGKVQGFRKFDKVKYFGKEYFIRGKMSSGFAMLMDIFNNEISFSHMLKGYKYQNYLI